MSTEREVSKKSAFPTSFDLSTVFKGILWMWTSFQNDQNMTSVFLCHVIWWKCFISKLQSKMENNEQIQFTGILTLFNSWLSPLGVSVSSFWIQKSSQRFNRNFKVTLSILWILLSCSSAQVFWNANRQPSRHADQKCTYKRRS